LKQLFWMGTALMALLLGGCSVIELGGATQPITGPVATNSAGEGAPDAALTACAEADFETTLLYSHPDEGYCFLYPADYTVEMPSSRVTVINGPVFDELNNIPVNLSIQNVAPVEGRTPEEFAEVALGDLDFTPDSGVIAGNEAAIIEDLPSGPSIHAVRSAYIGVGDTFYLLTVQPIDSDFEDANAQAEALWDMVTESLVFPEN